MTSTLTRPDVETEAPAEPVAAAPAAPEKLTFTVGTVTIDAKSEEEALRKYKRMVRSEGLKAKADMDWCVAGTNERLERLGVRCIGEGVPIRVVVTASRTMYLTVDADDDEEAREMMADGDDYILTLAKENMPGGWKTLSVEPAPPREGEYAVGQDDDTLSNYVVMQANPTMRSCERYSNRHGYCTRPAGHVEAGDRQHARGDGSQIIAVWKQRAPRAPEEGEPERPVIGGEQQDYFREVPGGATHCDTYNDSRSVVCTRPRGHGGSYHVGSTSNRRIVDVWDAE